MKETFNFRQHQCCSDEQHFAPRPASPQSAKTDLVTVIFFIGSAVLALIIEAWRMH